MRRAIQYLVERGMLVRKRGVGTQIVHPKVRRPVELSSLYDDLVSAGQRPRTEVLRPRVIAGARPRGRGARRARGHRGHLDRAAAVRRRRAAGADAQRDPGGRAARWTAADLDAARALRAAARGAGTSPRMANQVVGARVGHRRRGPDAAASRAARPLLTMTRTAWDAGGRAVEYGSHVYRASRYSFELSLTS